MPLDVIALTAWECSSTEPGLLEGPEDLAQAGVDWIAAAVPGTAAAALRDAGLWSPGVEDESLLDDRDWWFRCRFEVGEPGGDWELRLHGLATLADVWCNGVHVLHSENMFRAHAVRIAGVHVVNELVLRCAALGPALRRRHSRPRWKSRLVRSQSLRWYRTSLFGRGPAWSRWAAPVGPWRPIEMIKLGARPEVRERKLWVRCEGADGLVDVHARLRVPGETPAEVRLCVGDARAALHTEQAGDDVLVAGTLRCHDIERWWPHTHGEPRRYPAKLELGGIDVDLGSVGFRDVALDRSADGFTLRVNGAPVFCRGACWNSSDPVSLNVPRDQIYDAVRSARDAGMNMLRVPAYTWYEDGAFWDACDELGVLVWQDCMIASVDPPEDADFRAEIDQELREVFGAVQTRPALAIVCGSSEVYQQAAMLGLTRERWQSVILEEAIPSLVAEMLPGVPYVPSSPSGGVMPFDTHVGVAHYFGVGAYMRPLEDARLSNVRFAAECLAFGTPPEPETLREASLQASLAGHAPAWKATVARDAGTSWDFEDIRDHYVRELFDVDPFKVRYADPERALDLGRAAVAEAIAAVLTDWRRAGSACGGAIVLTMRDAWPGAGWGLLDSRGRPKASFHAFARVCAPRAVLMTDEGLAGICVHVLNDCAQPMIGRLALTIFGMHGNVLESAEQDVAVEAHGGMCMPAHTLLGGFRDLNAAYRFGPAAYDVALVELKDGDGSSIAEAVHPLSGPARPRLADVGLRASARPAGQEGVWALSISADAFAQYVAIDVPGFLASDSWFHLAPGRSRQVRLVCVDSADRARVPSGSVRALNSLTAARVDRQSGDD
jgi:beta-mannosidase